MAHEIKRTGVSFFLLLLLLSPSLLRAAEPGSAVELTPADQEFASLAVEFNTKLEDFWQKLGDITDRETAEKFDSQHDPGLEYLPKFLAFEQAHTGEDASLDALREIVNYAARSGDPESYRATARRKVLQRLKSYEDRELAILVVENLTSGAYDPQVLAYLRRLGDSPDANDTLRAVARITYAEKVLSLRAARTAVSEKLQNLADGMAFDHPEQEAYFREFLSQLPPAEELDAQANEATALLDELAASGESQRIPPFRVIELKSRIIRVDTEKENTNPPISAKAAALLFEERHLRPGQPAPELELELLDGSTWKLADQRGRVVVIQFSFTGCGPCEAMYPDLRAMDAELGDRLSIVTIMRDSTPDSAAAATESGKFTWDISCDGVPGTVCSRWAVDSFPEIYLIDATGRIAAVGPRGKQLRWKVEKLLAAEE